MQFNVLLAIDVRWFNATAYYCLSLAEALAGRGHRVRLLAAEGSPIADRAKAAGLLTHEIPSTRRLGMFRAWTIARGVGAMLAGEKADVIHAFRSESHALCALICRKPGWRAPLVRTLADPDPPLVHPLNGWLHTQATAGLTASCEKVKVTYMRAFGLEDEAITVIPAGLDAVRWREGIERGVYREQWGLGQDAALIGLVGRFDPIKGIETFLGACAFLGAHFEDVHFVLAGEEAGYTRAEIEETGRRHGLGERLHVLGVLDDVRPLIADLDIGVIASEGSETVCRIALEYMAFGVPVVATVVNAIPEAVLHDRTGIIVNPGETDELAMAIGALLARPDRARALGEAGRLRVETELSAQLCAEATEAVYERVLGR